MTHQFSKDFLYLCRLNLEQEFIKVRRLDEKNGFFDAIASEDCGRVCLADSPLYCRFRYCCLQKRWS